MKKTIYLLMFFVTSLPCSAQWRNASMGAQVLAFGVHDDSLFIGINPAGTPAPLVWRLVSLTPNVVWAIADNGIVRTQGNINSFASLGSYFFCAPYGHRIYETTNNGSNWSPINAASPLCSNGKYLFAYYYIPTTLIRSGDTGGNWDSIAAFASTSMATNGNCVYLTTSNELIRSLDNGITWLQISPPFMGKITVMGTQLLIPGNGKLALSTDSGTQWNTIPVDSAGVPEMVNCLATDGKNLFAGTPTGVLVSTDTGRDWKVENDSLANKNITNIGVFDTLLFIDVTTNGSYAAYYRPISEMTKPDSPASVVQEQSLDSLFIYPNPASGIVTIIAGGSSIEQISVLNILGEDVFSTPDYHESEINLDISKIPSGTYFLQIQTSEGVVLRKIVKEE